MKTFQMKTQVSMGSDSVSVLNELESTRLFVVCDPFMEESGMLAEILDRVKVTEVLIFSNIIPDPDMDVIVAALKQVTGFKPDLFLAVGGGSAIDSAKLIRYIYHRESEVKEVPLAVIPTTSGTGTEVTSFSVVTDAKQGRKYPLADERLLPDMAVLIPELTFSMPLQVTADTGMDVLTHAIEAYVSKSTNEFTDALAEKAVRLVFDFLPKAFDKPHNYEAREKMQNAACLAGAAFNQAALGLNHAMAHALGARFHISHGRSNAILLKAVILHNACDSEAADRFQNLALILQMPACSREIGVLSLVRNITELMKKIKIPDTIGELGIKHRDYLDAVPEMALAAAADECIKNNPVAVSTAEIEAIYKQLK